MSTVWNLVNFILKLLNVMKCEILKVSWNLEFWSKNCIYYLGNLGTNLDNWSFLFQVLADEFMSSWKKQLNAQTHTYVYFANVHVEGVKRWNSAVFMKETIIKKSSFTISCRLILLQSMRLLRSPTGCFLPISMWRVSKGTYLGETVQKPWSRKALLPNVAD